MIIKSSRNNSKFIYKPEDKPAIEKEVIVRPAKKAEKKKNKVTPEPVLETVLDEIVEEEKIDLSKWLEEDIDE